MKTELFWIDGLTQGKLAIAPRPRGGDWLADEVRAWRSANVDVIVSLLTADEIADLELDDEQKLGEANGLEFISFPIIDRSVPSSRERWSWLINELAERLRQGKNVVVHCRQGIGRAALVAIALLMRAGVDLGTAIQRVGKARGVNVPETQDQKRWLASTPDKAEIHTW
jgi:protein-tyrosine phosphatase